MPNQRPFFLMSEAELRGYAVSLAPDRLEAEAELLLRELAARRGFAEIAPPPATAGPVW